MWMPNDKTKQAFERARHCALEDMKNSGINLKEFCEKYDLKLDDIDAIIEYYHIYHKKMGCGSVNPFINGGTGNPLLDRGRIITREDFEEISNKILGDVFDIAP